MHFQKISVLTTPKTGSFSCRKSVSHERTSTVLKALSDKDTAAQSEVDAFMENCANRWQRREGTYQLDRRRLPPLRGQILAPFLGPFFNLHFGVQKWCKICKSFCCQSCITNFFPANKHAHQNASVVIF